jgi:hypothetical protein
MEYMLMFYETPKDFSHRPEGLNSPYLASWMAYIGAIREAGIYRAGSGLQMPSSGTTVRLRGDRRQVQDGPFADTKEQLGGYTVIEVPHLDAALEWAARAPCAATGGVEVRPVFSPSAST